jgi:hypothetical protein
MSTGPSGAGFIKHGGDIMARHTGTVSHLDPATGYGELAVEGRQPVAVGRADLRRINADTIGVIVDFEDGVLLDGHSGAVRLSRPGVP